MATVKSAELRTTAAEQAAVRAAAEAAAIIREPEAARQAAWQELAVARAALEAHHQQQQPKRQRVEGEAAGAEAAGDAEAAPEVADLAWRTRPYAKYDTLQKWVDREGELWNRRRVGSPRPWPEPESGAKCGEKSGSEIRSRTSNMSERSVGKTEVIFTYFLQD
jgi:hypothetical protein